MQLSFASFLSMPDEPAGPARSIPWSPVAMLVLAFSASCVPVTRYEEARSAAQVEMEGRRRAEHRVKEIEHERDRLRAELESRESALRQRDQAIDQSKLESTVLAKERDQATQLVDQLRGELARVGDHMRSFSEQKRDLEQALGSADALREQERRKSAERAALRARMARDLTLLLHEAIASGAYGLDVRDGELALNVADPEMFVERGAATPESAALVRAAARLAELYPSAKIEIRERDPASAELVAGRSARLEKLRERLLQQGVAAERVVLPPSSEAAPAPEAQPAATPAVPADQPETELEIRFLPG